MQAVNVHQVAKIGSFDIFAVNAKTDTWFWRSVEAEVSVKDDDRATTRCLNNGDAARRDVVVGTSEGSRSLRFSSCKAVGRGVFWSLGMLWLDGQGVPIGMIFNIGLIGTLTGGAFLYLWLVDPRKSLEGPP